MDTTHGGGVHHTLLRIGGEAGLCPAAAQGQDPAEAGGEEESQQGASLCRSLHTVGWAGLTQKAAEQSSLQKPKWLHKRGKRPASARRLLSFSIALSEQLRLSSAAL